MATERQSTGIEGLDRLIGGGIPRGSRCLLIGPHGSGKTVFAMQFLWEGLQAGETVSYDVFDRPWTKLRAYFASFGWGVLPYEKEKRLLPIQSFPHFEPYPRDPHVRYCALADFEEMKRIDLDLSAAGVSRFVFGDSYEHIFQEGEEARWHEVEQWTVNWSHHQPPDQLRYRPRGGRPRAPHPAARGLHAPARRQHPALPHP